LMPVDPEFYPGPKIWLKSGPIPNLIISAIRDALDIRPDNTAFFISGTVSGRIPGFTYRISDRIPDTDNSQISCKIEEIATTRYINS
jgi:hypothetical protein